MILLFGYYLTSKAQRSQSFLVLSQGDSQTTAIYDQTRLEVKVDIGQAIFWREHPGQIEENRH